MARASAGASTIPPLRASNTTKSLPRPCILKNAVMGHLIGWRGRMCQRAIDPPSPLREKGRAMVRGIFMRAGIGLAIGIVLALGWQARGAQGVNDPYLWLEDVHGEKALAWVKGENAKTLGVLTADPDYKK